MLLKSGVRILALNGAPFKINETSELVIGIVGRQKNIEGMISFWIRIDGSDSTSKIISNLKKSKFYGQVRIIVLSGITLGGLNIVDFERLSKELGVAVVGITRKRPRRSMLKMSLTKDPKKIGKFEIIERTYKKIKILHINGFYIQFMNIDEPTIKRIADDLVSLLRISHIVASGFAVGESKGRI